MTDDAAPYSDQPLEPRQPSGASLNFRKRLEELGQMALLVFILASAAFLSAITAMRIAIHGREVTMPNLVGKSVTEATSLLRSRGLVLRVADRIYSELPINVVVRQTPLAGLLMKESQQAHVVLSLGQRQLQIPLLEGNSLRASSCCAQACKSAKSPPLPCPTSPPTKSSSRRRAPAPAPPRPASMSSSH